MYKGPWHRTAGLTCDLAGCRYEQGRQAGEFSEQEMQRKYARESLERCDPAACVFEAAALDTRP